MINSVIIGLGILSILYYLILTLVMGSVAFSKIFILISFVSFIFYYVNKKYKIWDKKWFKCIIYLGLILLVIVEGTIIYYGQNRDFTESDYVVVLGAGLKGERMTLSLKERAEKALECSKENRNSYIVLSGGQGPGESISEAEAMKRYLLENGVEEKRLLLEDKSKNTMENFKFSKRIIEKHSGKTLEKVNTKIVTSNYHVLRSNIIAKRQGYDKVNFNSNKTNLLLAPNYFFREFFALPKTLLLDK